jgi:O-antigen ligase
MKASSIKYGVLTLTLTLLTLVLALMPFHAFLTVWGSSLFGHYTALRLWKEVLLVVICLGGLYLLLFDRKVRLHTTKRKLTWLIIAYLLVQLIWAGFALQSDQVGLKAAAYGVLLNSRFLLFFLVAWIIAVRTPRLEARWPKLLLWPAVAVVIFGLLQVFVLPPDFLRHFGYNADTIKATATINSNTDFYRYFSTLRGPNPLGAYLLLPISALIVLLMRFPHSWNWIKGLLLTACLAMLVFSFSRSAWIGAVLSFLTIISLSISRDWLRRYRRIAIGVSAGLLTIIVAASVLFSSSSTFQNAIFHTEDKSTVAVSSNDARASALMSGYRDIVQDPLGDGPGTAGPASVYNDRDVSKISENYYLQIGQETGVIGVLLFLLITATIGYILWMRRAAPLSMTLLAALVGLIFVNLVSHAWTDDTLAYIWWGLAGIAIGTPLGKTED